MTEFYKVCNLSALSHVWCCTGNVSLYPGNLFLAATQNRNGQMNLSKQTTVIEKTQKHQMKC